MTLKRETREQVGLKPPKNRRYDVNRKGVAIHWPGAAVEFRSMPHSKHREYVRNWQTMHMQRGSNDLEYGSLICPCGIWMEARTEFDKPMVRVGSNGSAQANADYTSVQMMLGNREQITRQEIAWLGEAVAWLRSQGWGRAVVGHRDLSQTSCPGDSIYAALPQIRSAADGRGTDHHDDDEEDDDMAWLMIRRQNGATYLLCGSTAAYGIYDGGIVKQAQAVGIPLLDKIDPKTWDALMKGRKTHHG